MGIKHAGIAQVLYAEAYRHHCLASYQFNKNTLTISMHRLASNLLQSPEQECTESDLEFLELLKKGNVDIIDLNGGQAPVDYDNTLYCRRLVMAVGDEVHEVDFEVTRSLDGQSEFSGWNISDQKTRQFCTRFPFVSMQLPVVFNGQWIDDITQKPSPLGQHRMELIEKIVGNYLAELEAKKQAANMEPELSL